MVASGPPLATQAVAQHTDPVRKVVELYRQPTGELVRLYEAAGRSTDADHARQVSGEDSKASEQALALFRVLCHRDDPIAHAFVQEQCAAFAAAQQMASVTAGAKAVEAAGRRLHSKAVSFVRSHPQLAMIQGIGVPGAGKRRGGSANQGRGGRGRADAVGQVSNPKAAVQPAEGLANPAPPRDGGSDPRRARAEGGQKSQGALTRSRTTLA